ncbi:hypothetical protein [Streptomyces lushanensis]|uniref:hypothetical protein n=1 Tax=Streptomyces lushanensis TaxID=1434255 RepID=UPI00114CD08E|nr:hypothetical protein [Streptomyces lushanensis]
MSDITSGWVYNSGAVGLRRIDAIHITDRGQGNTTKTEDWWDFLTGRWITPDCIFGCYPDTNGIGFILDNQVRFTDKQNPRSLADHFPTLPKDWTKGGITSAWVYNSGAVGLRRGDSIHITDRGKDNETKIGEWWKFLTDEWANPDCIFGCYPDTDGIGFILDNQVRFTDKRDPRSLAKHFPTLPKDWT